MGNSSSKTVIDEEERERCLKGISQNHRWPMDWKPAERKQCAEFDDREPTLSLQLASDLHLEFFRFDATESGKQLIERLHHILNNDNDSNDFQNDFSAEERMSAAIQVVQALDNVPDAIARCFDEMLEVAAPNLALIGDIGLPLNPKQAIFYVLLMRWCFERYERVFVVSGNHEQYTAIVDERNTVKCCEQCIQMVADAFAPRLVFLNRRRVDVDGVVVLGALLWTSVPAEVALYVEYLFSDYRRSNVIDAESGEVRRMRVSDTTAFHDADVAFVERELANVCQLNATRAAENLPPMPVVVLTHHAPSPSCCGAEHMHHVASHGSATDLRRLFVQPLRVWACGHTHQIIDEWQGQTRLVSNARGYTHELTEGYNRACVIHV